MVGERQLRTSSLSSQRAIQSNQSLQQKIQQQIQKRKQAQAQAQIKALQDKVNTYTDKINKGEIKNLNDIPADIKQYVNVTQQQLNQIQAQKREEYKQQLFNDFIQRKASGKGTAGYTQAIKKAFGKKGLSELKELIRTTPEIKRAVESGAEIAVNALKSGYKNTREYLDVQRNFQVQINRPKVQSVKTEEIKPTFVSSIKSNLLKGGSNQNDDNVYNGVYNRNDNRLNNQSSNMVNNNNSNFKKGLQKQNEDQNYLGGQIVQSFESLPPSLKQTQKERGFISGTLDWLSNKATDKVRGWEIKQNVKRISTPEGQIGSNPLGISKVVNIVSRNAPYFIPGVGQALLLGEGIEDFGVTKGARQNLRTEKAGLEASGKNKNLVYVQPALNVAVGGLATYPSIRNYASTLGRTKIPAENLIPEEVLSGKTNFPLGGSPQMSNIERAKVHKNLFENSPYRLPNQQRTGIFHATPERFAGKGTIVKGSTSEFQGLYGSYGISPHFLKVDKASNSILDYFTGDISLSSKPGVMQITPNKLVIGKSGKVGEAFIPGIKTEVEAILPPETALERTGQNYFFKYKGKRIPIDEYKVIPNDKINNAIPKKNNLVDLSSYYEGYGSSFRGSSSDMLKTISYKPKTSMEIIKSESMKPSSSQVKIISPSSIIIKPERSQKYYKYKNRRYIHKPSSELRISSKEISIFNPSSKPKPSRTNYKSNYEQPIKEELPKKSKLPSLSKTLLPKLKKKIKNGEFEVFGRRFGKDISLGVFSEKKQASKKLKGFLEKTLARSGFVKSGERKLSFEELDLGQRFRTAKKDKTRVVQRAKFSLGSGQEKSEIQFFKKQKSNSPRKKNNFWGF